MIHNPFLEKIAKAQKEKRRLVAPLVGFPGVNITGNTIKLAQQNFGQHYKIVKEIARVFEPDIIFPLMDLAVEANALGQYTVFPQQESATVVKSDFSIDDLAAKENVNIAFDTRLIGYLETMKLMSIGLSDSILRGAYVTGPYSLAALIMGADQAAMATVLQPDDLHTLCQFTTEKILEYVRLLIASGAQTICILEPSAVMLGPNEFAAFSGSYVQYIIESCKYTGIATIYHTCGNTMHLINKMVETGVSALSLDSQEVGVDLPSVAKQVPPEVIIMGNINPTGSLLNGTPEQVEKEVTELLQQMAPFPNFVLSTGCDLPQETPIENIHAFMSTGKKYRL